MSISLSRVRLSSQRALLSYVPSNLRAVYVSFFNNVLGIRFFFQGEVTEREWDIVETILTEIIADFCWDYEAGKIDMMHDAIRCDYPEQPPSFNYEECIYFRYEQSLMPRKCL